MALSDTFGFLPVECPEKLRPPQRSSFIAHDVVLESDGCEPPHGFAVVARVLCFDHQEQLAPRGDGVRPSRPATVPAGALAILTPRDPNEGPLLIPPQPPRAVAGRESLLPHRAGIS